MPNNETTVAMHTALLPLTQTTLDARKCDVLPALQQPLLSLDQFCDAGFTATLDSETVQLTNDGIATMLGMRDHTHGLYFHPLQVYPTSSLPPPTYNAPTRNFHTNQCSPQSPTSLRLRKQRVPHEHSIRPGTVTAQDLL